MFFILTDFYSFERIGTMVIAVLCIVFGIALVVKHIVNKWRMESFTQNVPTMKPCYPMIGSAFQLVGKNSAQVFSMIVQAVKAHSTPCKAWLGPVLAIVVDRPEDVRTVLMSTACLDKPYMYRFLPSTSGLLTAASTCILATTKKICFGSTEGINFC